MTPSERVAKLVAEGRLGAAEGERLLATLARPRPLAGLDPFVRFGGGVAAVIGLLAVLASLGLAGLGVRFDGVLDLHVRAGASVSLGARLADQAVAVVLPTAAFWAYARSRSAHVRLVDFAGAVGLARVPVVLGAYPMLLLAPPPDATALHLTPALLVVAGLAFAMLALQIALLFFGFRNASGLQGPRLGVGFTAVLLGAEVLSKLALLALR